MAPMPATCAECGAPLPENAPGNRCPKCLLQLALEEPGNDAEPGKAPEPGGSAPEAPDASSESDSVEERIGTTIGRYKLLQQIGEGGFGIVFMAEQTEPVQRKVALKVIKAGMDTREVIARFEAERQALALMDHANIARVLDAGATESRRPYFVMELVQGGKLTDYCDQANLSTRQRLELFIKVCRAVQHAHQKGVIHRDLKPTNVLVTLHDGEAVPKVIDFGVAKALGQKLTEKTLFTRFEQMIGTPAYMSPEQAALGGLDIDTRSDIYSLGVLLYELLTGVTPLDAETLRKGALDEVRRMIRETDPPKPSTRLQTMGGRLAEVARCRQAEPAALSRLVRDDLDWITMKCLEKDRQRRYETVNGLAKDIERHLRNELVVARPPSRAYQFQKLVRRNKLAFGAATAIAIVLIMGAVASTWEAVRARRAEREQNRLRQEAEAARAQEATLRAKAEVRERIERANTLYHDGKYGEAEKLLNAIPATASEPNETRAELLRSLGTWHARQGQWREAAMNFDLLLKLNELQKGDRRASSTSELTTGSSLDYLYQGPLLVELGDQTGYEILRRSTITRLSHTTDSMVAERVCKGSLLLPADEKLTLSLVPLYDMAVRAQEQLGLDPNMGAWACISLALVDYRLGNYTKSAEWSQRCLSSADKNAARTATAQVLLAMACQRLNRQADAQAHLSEAAPSIEGALKSGGSAFADGPPYKYFDWMFARVLCREASALIGAVGKAPQSQ